VKTGLLVLVLVSVSLAGSKYVSIRNGLAGERRTIQSAWTQVETALTHRASLIPDFVEVFGRSVPNSGTTVRSLNDARMALDTAHQPSQKIQANAGLDNALARALLAAEGFPKFDGSKRFGDLQDALKEAEYKIAVERRKYNEAVEHYNTRTVLFPNNVVASLSGFRHIDEYIPTTGSALVPTTGTR
jgi:LemA protein